MLVNRACWGWVFLTEVNGSIREADGVGGVCGGQMHPSLVHVLYDGLVRAGRIRTELNGYVSAPPRSTSNFDQRRRVREGCTQTDLNGLIFFAIFVAAVRVLEPVRFRRM